MEIFIIILLTLLNGFFSLSEIALVSVKKNRMEHLAAKGSQRAKTVLKLLDNPENFLSSVQVGITLVGIISGAYGGATLTDDLESVLVSFELFPKFSHDVALIIVIGAITYFTIVIGELVPKTIAMNHAESIALFSVPIIKYFTYAVYPFVKLLSISTNLILKLFGVKEGDNDHINEEELKFLLSNAGKSGVLETEESQVHQNIFYFTDQTAKSLMTHSSELEWIDYQEDKIQIFEQLKESVHSKFIVSDGTLEKVKGIISIKDFFEHFGDENFTLDSIIEDPIFFIQNTPSFKILNTFKVKKQYIGIVIDEFGSVLGIITLHDLMEAIIGDLPDEDETDEKNIIERGDGTFLIDGKTLIFELNQHFQREIIEDSIENYTTVAGFMLNHLKTMPESGDLVEYNNFIFEVMDIDGVRIDKILMRTIENEENN